MNKSKQLSSEKIEEDFNAAHLSAEEFASGYGQDLDTIPEDDDKFDLASADDDLSDDLDVELDSDLEEDLLPKAYHEDDEDIEEIKKASRH